jgi:hypothetical protein
MPSERPLNNNESLVERFVSFFDKLGDEMVVLDGAVPLDWPLATGDRDQYGRRRWRPIKVNTELSFLDPIYSKLPARFPPLYERLVLSYRWAEVDLQSYRLLANPPGPDLNGLLQQMSGNPAMWSCLLQAGYIQFGRGPDFNFDAICFDVSARKKNRDCKIVQIDHEQILCNNRVKVVAEMAPSFEQLVLQTIDGATKPK